MRKNSIIAFLWGALCFNAFAQESDTTRLTLDQFLQMVQEHHPAAVQARLLGEMADAERLKASGSFDPKLFSEVDQKYYDDKTYYRLQNSGVKIPAWFGLSGKLGYENSSGTYLNPMENTPPNGLLYGEISSTLIRGLIIDERRAVLRQARLMQEASEAEIRVQLNDLFGAASRSYWNWYQSQQTVEVYREAVGLAEVRFNAIKENARLGEIPYIDTLEAKIQYQNRWLALQKSMEELQKARQDLETYLWLDGQVPLELEQNTRPIFFTPALEDWLSLNWLEEHPLLNFYNLKVQQLEIEQKLNREQLKPQVDLSYKFLATPAEQIAETRYAPQNYAWGLKAGFPIFLRKERGEIRKTGVKIRDTELEIELKRRQLANKLQAMQNNLTITLSRLEEQRKVVNNYSRLLRAELIRFDNGESSLFLINQREMKYLESQEKLLELEADIHQKIADIKATAALF